MKLKDVTKRMICLALAAAAVGLSAAELEDRPLASAEPDGSELQQRLAEIDREQQELDERIANADDSAEGKRHQLEAVNKKIKSIEEEIIACEEYSVQLEDEMVALDSEMRETNAALSEQEKMIKEELDDYLARLRALYLAGSYSYTDVLLDSDDFYDVLMRTELIKRVAEHDNNELDSMLARLEEIKALQSQLDEESLALREKASEYSDRYIELNSSRDELSELKRRFGDELAEIQDELDRYEDEQRQLDEERRLATSTTTTTTTTTSATTTTAAPEPEPEPETETETTTVTTAAPEPVPEETETTSEEEQPQEPAGTTAATTTTTAPAPTTTTTTTTAPPAPAAPDTDKAAAVVAYAKSNVGGTYIWGGASFKACDCSGLVMLSYAQVGISLPHYTVSQAAVGKDVSYSDMVPGDCIYFGSSPSTVYHVAMYIGDGKMVHAENSNTGIVISSVSVFSLYNRIACIRRFL